MRQNALRKDLNMIEYDTVDTLLLCAWCMGMMISIYMCR